MRRIFALLLCVLMISALAACKDKGEDGNGQKTEKPPVTSVVQNGDVFHFVDVDSETVRITRFETENDKAHEVTIPAYLDGKLVVAIDAEAFASKSSISKINFPTEADLKAGNPEFDMAAYSLSIAECAFRGCDNLVSVTIPAYVNTIGGAAFYECIALESVTFEAGSKLSKLETATFWGCASLKAVTIPGNVKSIGKGAFFECFELQSVTLEEGVAEIGLQAFQRCKKLESVNVASTVTLVLEDALSGCEALTTVTYNGTSEQVLAYISGLNLK